MSWRLVRLACRCWFCKVVIAPGDLARDGNRTPAVWCVACALKDLGETPPAEFLAAAPVPMPASASSPAPPQPTLFGVDELAGQFKHADARVALERLRSSLDRAEKERS